MLLSYTSMLHRSSCNEPLIHTRF